MFLPSRRRARIGGLAVAATVVTGLLSAPGSAIAVEAVDRPDLLVAENSAGAVTLVPGDDSAWSTVGEVPFATGVAQGPDGDVYVAAQSQVVRIPADGSAPVVLDRREEGAETSFWGVAVDEDGDVYASSEYTREIFRYPADGGEREVFARGGRPGQLHMDSEGNLLVADAGNGIALSIAPSGERTELATGLGFVSSVEQRPDGSYVTTNEGGQVTLIPEGGGTPTTLASIPGAFDSAVDKNNDVYVASSRAHSLVRIPADGGEPSTVVSDLHDPLGVDLAPLAAAPTLQEITFTSERPPSARVGDTYAPTATGGGSGNPVTFSTATPDSCSYDAGTGLVTFEATQLCTIAADQTGGSKDGVTYAGAEQVTQSLTPEQGFQTITYTSEAPDDARAGDTYTPTATGGGSDNPVVFTIDAGSTARCSIDEDGVVTFDGAGLCTINADQVGDDDYRAAETTRQQVVPGFVVTETDLDVATGELTATVTVPSGSRTVSGPVAFVIDPDEGDEVDLGTAQLTAVPGEPGTSVAVLVLDEGDDPGSTGIVRATYAGDDTAVGGSVGDYRRLAPSIAADVRDSATDSFVRPNAAGWYRTPVRVDFTCAANTAALIECPDHVDQGTSSEGFILSRTLRADDGGITQIDVPLQVDIVRPVLRTRRVGTAPFSRTARPIRCSATDAVSGVDGTCAITYGAVVRGPQGRARRAWSATVTDVAGNTRTRSNRFVVTGKAPTAR